MGWEDDDSGYKADMIHDLMKIYNSKNNGGYVWNEEEDDVDEDELVDDDEELVDYAPVRSHNYRVIADRLMRELVANGLETMIMLKDDEVRDWWADILREEKRKADELARKEAAKRKREDDARAKAELISRLTPEERRLLGIKGK